MISVLSLRAGDHDWKVAFESGYFRPGHALTDDRIKMLSVATLQWRAVFNGTSDAFAFQIKGRPEWYGPDTKTFALAGGMDGQYRHRWGQGSATAHAGVRRNAYYTPNTDVVSDAVSFRLGLTRVLNKRTSVEAVLPLSYAVTSTQSRTRLFLVGASLRLNRTFSNQFRGHAGLIAERFVAKNDDDLLANRNEGHRLGVEVNAELLQPLFLSVNYRLYRHSSDLTIDSWDHEVQCMAGRRLSERWSIYGLIDYYRRDIRTPSGLTSTLLFTHTNNERRASLKTAYAASARIDISAKISYQRTELVYESLVWSGLQLSAGLEWRR